MPCFHWLATSSQEVAWNSKSWPEAMPRQKKGATTSRETHKERRRASRQAPGEGAATDTSESSRGEFIQLKRIVTAKELPREDRIRDGMAGPKLLPCAKSYLFVPCGPRVLCGGK